MAKTQEKTTQDKESKPKKEPKAKNVDALVGRVKKVVKKSRRKLDDEKFEKQLQRTIAFLEALQLKMNEAETSKAEKRARPVKKAKSENAIQQKKIKAKSKPAAKV